MNNILEMPESNKFQHAFGMVRLYQKHVLPFVEERLGFAAMHELRAVWQAAIIPTRENGSATRNYESAYSN